MIWKAKCGKPREQPPCDSQHDGIEGVDLLLSTYGPTLSVISRHWPVYSSTPDASRARAAARPEEALDLAREEVVRLRRARLVGKAAHIDDYYRLHPARLGHLRCPGVPLRYGATARASCWRARHRRANAGQDPEEGNRHGKAAPAARAGSAEARMLTCPA